MLVVDVVAFDAMLGHVVSVLVMVDGLVTVCNASSMEGEIVSDGVSVVVVHGRAIELMFGRGDVRLSRC